MKRSILALLSVIFIAGCGGSTTTPPPPVTTTTTLPPNFSGSYSGLVVFNVAGQAEIRPTARVTVTHAGNTITYSNLVVTVGTTPVSFPLGTAGLSGSQFVGANAYQSSGCGVSTANSVARFAGNLMNLQVSVTSAGCAESRMVGELSR
jgi:hypothetical protein